jgi:hypothetical protein
MKAVALACLLAAAAAASSAKAQQSLFVTPPARTITVSTQAQGPVRSTPDLNQATMNQIINQLSQRQLQLKVAATQTAPQRTLFLPQRITVKRAK